MIELAEIDDGAASPLARYLARCASDSRHLGALAELAAELEAGRRRPGWVQMASVFGGLAYGNGIVYLDPTRCRNDQVVLTTADLQLALTWLQDLPAGRGSGARGVGSNQEPLTVQVVASGAESIPAYLDGGGSFAVETTKPSDGSIPPLAEPMLVGELHVRFDRRWRVRYDFVEPAYRLGLFLRSHENRLERLDATLATIDDLIAGRRRPGCFGGDQSSLWFYGNGHVLVHDEFDELNDITPSPLVLLDIVTVRESCRWIRDIVAHRGYTDAEAQFTSFVVLAVVNGPAAVETYLGLGGSLDFPD